VLSTISVSDKVASDSGVGSLAFTSRDVPGVSHHEFEVSVIVNAHRDIVVVLNPLFFGNTGVSDVVNIG